MNDRFDGAIRLGGRITAEQFAQCEALLDGCLEFAGELEEGSAFFHECNADDFKKLVKYCKDNGIPLCIMWDGSWNYPPKVDYWIDGNYKFFYTDNDGDIVVQVADLESHKRFMTIQEYVDSLGIPKFPEFEIAE